MKKSICEDIFLNSIGLGNPSRVAEEVIVWIEINTAAFYSWCHWALHREHRTAAPLAVVHAYYNVRARAFEARPSLEQFISDSADCFLSKQLVSRYKTRT